MKTLIIIFLLFLGTVMPHTIVLDGQNPFIIQKSKNTSSASSTTTNIDLIMNISFPYGSKGLQYKQYIALRFPQLATGINGNQALNSANSANDSYQCLLTNKDSNTSILLTYVKTPYFQGESNTIFCMLSDTSKEAPLKSNVNYQFMIRRQSSSNDLSTNFMNNFNLFTLTNNNDLALIIDTAYGFGSGINTSETTNNNPITLQAIDVVDSNLLDIGSISPIYQYKIINLRLRFLVNTLFRFENAAIMIEYPDTNLVFKMADKILSFDAVAGDNNRLKLGGDILLNQYDINSQHISGFNEVWLNKGREFYLVLYNVNIGDGSLNTQKLKTGLMFKNSNLVRSITFQNFPTVIQNNFVFTIDHPEGWDVYMSGAWPLLFKYGVTSLSLASTNGFYVTIKHSNLIPAFEVFNFVASTCDFSLNDVNDTQFSKAFGVRNNCFPIQPTDLYANASFNTLNNNLTVGTKGSGIFFRQKNFNLNTIYSLLVWGVADVCGKPNIGVTTDAANLADPLTVSTSATTAVNFKFDFTVYNLIDQTKENSDRFNTNNAIGTVSNKVSSFKCYSVFRGYYLSSATDGLGFEQYEGASNVPGVFTYRNTNLNVPSTTTGLVTTFQPATAKYDNLLYKEFTDPVIMDGGDVLSNGIPTVSSDYQFNVSGPGTLTTTSFANAGYGVANSGFQAFQPLFIYSDTLSNNVIGKNKAVLIRGDFFIYNQVATSLRDSKSGLPSPVFLNRVATDSGKISGLWAQQQGVLEVLFSSNYFEKGVDLASCAVSWQVSNVAEGIAAKAETSVNIATTSSGYLKSFFPLNSDGITFSGWPSDPSNLTLMNPISLNLKNNFIKGQTINGALSNLTPPKILIRSIMNSAGNDHPGGQYFTVNHATLGYTPSTISTPTAQNPALFCCNTYVGCNLVFNLYTNCLKWANTYPTNKTLYNYIDIVYRFLPALNGALTNNGPNRVIRFIKLFPEAQGFQDVQKRTTFNNQGVTTLKPITIHYTFIGEDSLRDSTSNNYQGMGTTCLVQISNKAVNDLLVYTNSKANTLALFLFNIPLIDVDVTDASSTYPIGSLSQGVSAYGLNSAPTFTRYGHLGSNNIDFNDTTSYGQRAAGLTKLTLPLSYTTSSGLATSVHHTTQGEYSQSRSSYQFLLGSVILITGISTGSNPVNNSKIAGGNGNQDLFIPTRCPTGAPTTTYLTPSYFSSPTIYLTSMTASDYGNFTSVEKILKYFEASVTEYSIMKANIKTTDIGSYTNKKLMYMGFNKFGTSRTDGISISNYHTNASAIACSGYNYFFSDKIKIDKNIDRISFDMLENTTTNPFTANYMSLYTSTKYFYFNGQKFSQAASLGTSDSSFAQKTTSSVTSSNTKYVYIYTKSLTSVLDSNANGFYPDNLVSGGCASSGNSLDALSNLQVFSSSIYYFNISIEKYNEIAGSTPAFSIDIDSGINYKNDPAGNIKFKHTYASNIPAKTNVSFAYSSTNSLTTNMVCGILLTDNYVENCNLTTSIPLTISCSNPTLSNSVTITCYNVDLSTNFSISQIDYSLSQNYISNIFASSISLSFPAVVSNTFYSLAYQAGNPIPTYSNNNSVDIKTLSVSSFDILTYSIIQENAIGKLTLGFTLPRQPVRNSKIIIEGDFSMFINSSLGIKKEQTRCVASFSNLGFGTLVENNGDSLIDYCDISNIESSKKIIVSIKNIIWKSNLTMNTTVFVNLTPVILGKIPIGYQYKVSMVLPSNKDTIEPLGFTNTSKEPFFKSLQTPPKVPFKIDTLCPYTISSLIPNSMVDIEFEFDLITNKTEIDLYNLAINEFTVVLPFNYFGDYANSGASIQNCYINANGVRNNLPCLFSSEGILNIDIKQYAISGNKIKVGIQDIIISDLPPTNLSIICSVNSIDITRGKMNLLTGSGKNLNTLTYIPNFAKMYNINFFPEEKSISGASSGFYSSSNSTEALTTMTLRFGIDFSLGASISNDILVDKDPIVHVYFPIGYSLSNNASATMEQFKSDNNSLPLSSQIIPIKSVNISTRRISVNINSNFTISSNHKYFDLKIVNVINPIQAGITGRFNIAITNSDFSWLIRSFTSAHDQATNLTLVDIGSKIINNNVLDVFKYYRGIQLSKNGLQNLLVTLNGNNNIVLNLGRFSKFDYVTTSDSTSNSIFTKIINEDTKIKFPSDKEYFLNSFYKTITVSLGVSCSESSASNYILNIKGSNPSFNFVPVKVSINSNTKGVIKFEPESSYTIKGGMILIHYSLDSSDTNYDIISEKWNPAPTNDVSSSLTIDDIPPNSTQGKGVFKITNDKIATTQIFNINLNNNCFNIDISQAKFELNGSANELSFQSGVENWFTYIDPEQDKALTLRRTSFHVTVTPTIGPIRIFCVISCSTSNTPTNIELREHNYTPGPFLQTFSTYLYKQTAKEMFFDGLVRGEKYALTCLIEYPLAVSDPSKTYGYNIVKTNNGLNIGPQKTELTKCARISFANPVSDNTKSILVSFCSGLFSPLAKNPTNDGCVDCYDEDGKNVFGAPWQNLQCPVINNRLRFLQTIKHSNLRNLQTVNNTISDITSSGLANSTFTSNSTSTKDLRKITVCALQSKLCPTNTEKGIAYIMQNEFIDVLLKKKRSLFDFASTLSYLNNTVSGIELIDETAAPNVTYTLGGGSYLLPTTVNINLILNSDSDYDWNCYFKLDLSSKELTAEQIRQCTSIDSCGNYNVFGLKNVPTSLVFSANYYPFLTIGKSYSTFLVCYHNIMGGDVPSSVQKFYKFTAECKNNYMILNGQCILDDNYIGGTVPILNSTTSTDTNTTGGNYMIKIWLCLCLYILILY